MIVDVHAHHVPQGLIHRVLARPVAGVGVIEEGAGQYRVAIPGRPPTRVLPARLIDLHEREAWMDDHGIDIQVLATWADIVGYELPPEVGADWATVLNDTLRDAVAGSPRFEALATLPMQDPTASATMMDRALDDGFRGVTIGTRIGNMELDDERMAPFWEAASDLRALVFIHPGYGAGDPRTADYGLVNAVGRAQDTTIAAARLLFGGVPGRYPGARILLAHGGGAVPYLLGRLKRNRELDTSLGDPEEGFSRLLFDSVVFDPASLCFLRDRASSGSILLGSDYPFPIGDPNPLRVVEEASLSSEERASILGGAAIPLLGLSPAG